MELSPRKQAVLKAIVTAYIKTGEPVGSKNLTALLENAPSSATLRNEMSELCELGFLQQPHTSAGRIPTVGGYRFYVDSIMRSGVISESVRGFVDKALDESHCEAEQIPETAAQMLSQLIGLPAIACTTIEKPSRIKRLELLPINRYSVMLLIITDDGRTRSRIFRQNSDFTGELELLFKDLTNRFLIGKRVDELNIAYMQNVVANAGIKALELIPLFTAVCETAALIGTSDVRLKNEGALYNICGDEKTANRVLNLIKRRDPIIALMENIGDGVGAVFGADTGYSELERDTIVAARFSSDDKYTGYIGIIGPNRMHYEQIMPVVKYTAERLTEIMTEAQKDMED